MNLLILSAKSYDPQGPNYGDCLLLNTGTALVVYDCGCEEHAKRVETYMSDNGFSKAIVILSHNDADHFNGIPYLVEKGLVSKVYTQLFLKHKEEVLKLLDDGRVTEHSIGERIKKVYDNIASLSKQVELVDALTANEVVPGISIVGPTELPKRWILMRAAVLTLRRLSTLLVYRYLLILHRPVVSSVVMPLLKLLEINSMIIL